MKEAFESGRDEGLDAGSDTRVWKAAQASLAAMTGPGGLAISSTLLCVAACAAASALHPEVGMGLKSPEFLALLGAGAAGVMGSVATLAAGVDGFVKGFKSLESPNAAEWKESLSTGWARARDHLIYGGAGVALFAGASVLSTLGGSGVTNGQALLTLASVPVAMTAAAATALATAHAVSKAFDLPESESPEAPSEPPAARLSKWREAKSAAESGAKPSVKLGV